MRPRALQGIRAKLFLFTWVMGILPLAASSILSYLITHQILMSVAKVGLQSVPRIVARQMEITMDLGIKTVQSLAITREVVSGNPEERTAHFHRILKIYPQFLWIGTTDVAGRIVAATDSRSLGQDVSRTPWFRECQATLRGGIVETKSHRSRHRPVTPRDLPHIGFTAPLLDPSGRFLGALHVDVKIKLVKERMRGIQIGKSGYVLLIGPQGEVIASSHGSGGSALSLRSYRLARSGRTGIVREADPTGQDAFISFAPVGGPGGSLGWSVLAIRSTEEVFAASRVQLKLFGIILFLGTLFILMGSFFLLGRGIADPIRRLMYGVRAVGRGDFGHRVKVQDRDELGALAEAFNEMVSTLEAKSKALQAKSEELDGYIYAISHDLRSPLISIQGHSTLLARKCQAILGESERCYLDRIRANSRQMEELIESLLELSRAGRMSPSFTEESLTRILEEVREELSYFLEQGKVQLVIDPKLPPIYCDRKGIRQVFANLIQNAISAVKGIPRPTIEVGTLEAGSGGHHFYVRDNGVGIDRRHHQRIFEPFQSLFSQEGEEKGKERKGLGLAIVKKIIQAHGGEIWVESEPGQGATFHVTLPRPS